MFNRLLCVFLFVLNDYSFSKKGFFVSSWCDLGYLKRNLNFYVQPIVDGRDKSHVGCELLARLAFQNKNLSPDFFIPILESCGLYPELDRKLAIDAVSLLRLSDKHKFVSINIQNEDSLVFHANNPCYEGFESRIHFELLESFEWSSPKSALIIDWASKKGFKLFLDDFGTGFSNIKTLLLGGLYGVKIDRTVLLEFIACSGFESLKLLVDFLLSRNKKIIFEGVEFPSHEAFIKRLDEDVFLQGFLYGKPEKI